MPKTRSLAIVLVLMCFGLGGWLLLRSNEGAALPVEQEAARAAELAAASLRAAGSERANEAAESASADPAGSGARAVIADSGCALVGRVNDAAGKPIAQASVQCTPNSGFDGETDISDFDEQKWLALAREARAHRVETKTDAEGRFRTALPMKGNSFVVRITARGHLVYSQTLRRPEKGDLDAGTVTLKAGAVVAGRVIDRAGKAVAKAMVRGERSDSGIEQFDFAGLSSDAFNEVNDDLNSASDSEGRFELRHVQPGDITVSARHADYPVARAPSLKLEPGATVADLVLTFEPGTTIRGKVIGAPPGVKGLRVVAGRKRAEGETRVTFMFGMEQDGPPSERGADPASDGSFVLRGLALDKTYQVWVSQRHGRFGQSSACSQRTEVRAGAETVELRYEAGVEVSFRVVESGTGKPIERLWVNDRLKGDNGFPDFGFGSSVRARDYPEGRVVFGNLRPKKKQTLSLAVEATGFKKFERDNIELPLIGALELGTVQLQPIPLLRVQVTSAVDGQPVANAQVRVASKPKPRTNRSANPFEEMASQGMGNGNPLSAKTDAEGRCTLNSIPGAEVVLSVTSQEFAPYASLAFTLPEATDAAHDVRLSRGGTVVIEVVDADSKPVDKADVAHRGTTGTEDTATTDTLGCTTFVRLAPGEHRFRLGRGGDGVRAMVEGEVRMRLAPDGTSSSSRQDDWKNVDVVEGAETKLRLIKPPSARLTGIVRENGKPLAGADVAFVSGDGRSSAVTDIMRRMEQSGGGRRTDEQGRYQLTEVRTGEHRLRVTHRDRAMPEQVPVSLRAGDNVFDIELDVSSVRGVVRGPDDKPIVGASVRATDAGSRTEASSIEGMPSFGRESGRRASAKTDAEGRYELRGVATGGKIMVRATAKGFAAATSQPIEPVRGGTVDCADIRLVAAGALRVRASSDVPFAMVNATFLGDDKSVAAVNSVLNRGEATLDGLREGRWKVRLSLPSGEPQMRDVEVRAGVTTDVNF